MSTQGDLQLIENILNGLNGNPVARLSYTQAAFDQDDADGVDVFDVSAEQNIPKADKTDYNPAILGKGIRAQGASVPRMGWNHYVGRLSYNLNKLVQKVVAFFGVYRSSLAHNANEYDSSAKYRQNDVCYTVEIVDNVRVYTWWQRFSSGPETISDITPPNTLHWKEMQNKTSSSALLPFSAPGYRCKFTVLDLTGADFLTDRYYPVTTELRDFDVNIPANARTNSTIEAAPVVRIEAYCDGTVAGRSTPHLAGLSVLSKFTGFPSSSTDVLLNDSFVDRQDGTVRDVTDSPVGYTKLVKGRQAVVWLRGGSKYALWNSFGSDFTPHTTQYANGVDDSIDVSQTRQFAVTPGAIKARVKSVEATEADDAVVKSQSDGMLPMPKALGAGAQLNSVRTPGSYVVTETGIAGSIQQAPVENPGPFEMVVRGDKAGLSVTTQQFTVRSTGEEFTRVLSGNEAVIDWYLSGSPHGTNVGVSGLYVFKVINGDLYVIHREGDDSVPSFSIDNDGDLVATFYTEE
jgi:hypothetical protein